MFDRETEGRIARAEISVFDAMMAEIATDKEIRLRKFLRKHEVRHGNPVRKEKRKAYVKEKYYSCDPWHGFDTVRNFRHAEKIRTDAEDWENEQEAIAEDERIAEIIAEYRKFSEQIEHERKMRKLNEWLKYA